MRILSGLLFFWLFVFVPTAMAENTEVMEELAYLKEKQQYKQFYAKAFMGLVEDPSNVTLMGATADGLRYNGMLYRSLAVVETILAYHPDNEDAKARKSELENELAHIEKRIAELEAEVEAGTGGEQALGQLTAIYVNLGDYAKARHYLNQAEAAGNTTLIVRLMSGAFTERIDTPTKQAIDMAQSAVDRLDEGRLDEAHSLIERALTLSAISPFVYNKLATILIREKKPAAASMVLEEIMHIQPEASVLLEAANLAYAAGDLNRALRLYDRELREYGDDPVAYYNMGLCLARLGDAASAEAHMKKARELNPDLKPDPDGMIRVRGVEFKP